MTSKDHRIIFTALGFLAVILRDDLPIDRQGARATSIARLIESFCITSMPDALSDERVAHDTPSFDIECLAKNYVATLRATGSVPLDFDRATLLKMYELLTIQKMRHEQKAFYASSHNDLIANNILRLAEEQIRWEEGDRD